MAVQDRNIHKDAIALRRALSIPVTIPVAGNDQDEPLFVSQPRYNYRISDLSVSAMVVATAPTIVKAQVVPELAVCGEPQVGDDANVTFSVEEFWHNDDGVIKNVAATAAQVITTAFTVLEDFWGVMILVVDGAQVRTTIAQAPVMAFATEALALANCPTPPAGTGIVAIVTIEATGADFVAKTDDTDTSNAFNTAPRDGHVATLAVLATPQHVNATLAQVVKDASGTRILEGKGGVGGDLLIVTGRMTDTSVLTDAVAVIDIRPFPAQGEGRGNMSVSNTAPSFIP